MSEIYPTAGYGGSQPPNGLPVFNNGSYVGNAGSLTMGPGQAFSFSGTSDLILEGGTITGNGGVVVNGTTFSTLVLAGGINYSGTAPNLTLTGYDGFVYGGATFQSIAETGNISLSGTSGVLTLGGGGIEYGGTLYGTIATQGDITLTGTGSTLNLSAAGGYQPGTLPTVSQVAYAVNGGNAVTFGSTPASGDLLVAMVFEPAALSAASGWFVQSNNLTGTDNTYVLQRTAGASEPAAQTIVTGGTTSGALVCWDIKGANTTTPKANVNAPGQNVSSYYPPSTLPLSQGCIGLSALAVVSGGGTILSGMNVGTDDVLNESGSRLLLASHTDLSKTPSAGLGATFNNTATAKSAIMIVTT